MVRCRCAETDERGYTLHHCEVNPHIARRLDHPQIVPQPGMTPSERMRMELLPVAHVLPPEVFDAYGFDESFIFYNEEAEALGEAYLRAFPSERPSDSESQDSESDEGDPPGPEDDGTNQTLLSKREATKPTPAITKTESPSLAESSTVRRKKRMVVDPELARARRASLRSRARET